MSLHPELHPGEIITLNVDFGDGSEVKLRSALVISQNILHQNSQGFVFLGITTNTSGQFMLPILTENVESGRLNQHSSVIYDKPIWAEQRDIRGKIGKVNIDFLNQVMALMRRDILS